MFSKLALIRMIQLVTKISSVFETRFKVFVTLRSQSQKKKKGRKIRTTIVKTVENDFKGHPTKMKIFKSDSLYIDKNCGSTIATFTMVLEIFLPEI